MKKNASVPLLLITFLVAASAGCLDGRGVPAQATPATSEPEESSSPRPDGPAVDENTAPELVIRILDNGTAIEAINGSYPALAGKNLTFDASASRDAEGDALSFVWSFGDGNSSTAAAPVHAFLRSGNYSVEVKVTDGRLSDTDSILLAVAPAGPVRTDTKTFEGTLLVGTQDPAVAAAPCGALEEEGVDQKTFTWTLVDVEPDGTMSYVKHVVIRLDSSGAGAMDVDIFLYDPSGRELGKAVTGSADETIELADQRLPAGDYAIKVVACNVADIDVVVTAQADYYPA